MREKWGGDTPPGLVVTAVNGVATFDTDMHFLMPSVLVHNKSGFPYVGTHNITSRTFFKMVPKHP